MTILARVKNSYKIPFSFRGINLVIASLVDRGLRIAKVALQANRLRKLDSESKKEIAKRALVSQFSDARGALMKVGQLLTASQDDSFDSLVKGIPAVELEGVLPSIEAALGKPLGSVFQSIEESDHAASLGQVHAAKLSDGKPVAVKVRYPDISDQVQAEIKLFGLMPGLGPVKEWGMDLESYKQNFKNNMDRELDYREESRIQQLFKNQLDISGLCVPSVYSDYTRPDLLVQSWESGQYIDEIVDWPVRDKRIIAEILLTTLFKSLFELGVVHGDPHKGNYYFRRDQDNAPEVVLMDFGCHIEISEQSRLAFLNLILAVSEGKSVIPLRNFTAMGFDPKKLIKLGDTLPMLCRFLFMPFTQKGLFHIQHWELEASVERLLGEKKWWFRSAGPSQLFMIMRAFQGIVQHLQTLGVSLSWQNLLLRSLCTKTLEKARTLQLQPMSEEQEVAVQDVSSLAKKLCIRVYDNEKEKVKAEVPAELALDLGNLMPDDVLASLQKSEAIDLDKIQQDLKESGLIPQNLFQHINGSKRYEVWLE